MIDQKNTPSSLIQAKVPNQTLEFLQDFYSEYPPKTLKRLHDSLNQMAVGSEMFDLMTRIERVNLINDINRIMCLVSELRKPLKTATEVMPRRIINP